MKRSILILMILVLLAGLIPAFALAAGADGLTVSLRIEGKSENLYYDEALDVAYTDAPTLLDVLTSAGNETDAPDIKVGGSGAQERVTVVDGLSENSVGGLFSDQWMIRLNGEAADAGLQNTTVENGDEIILYYGDPELMQYPEMDLTRMLTDGIIRFTSEDTGTNSDGSAYITTNPVVGAIVTWDGMTYKTDASGEIIIDSTGAGVTHSVGIERYYENGLPTVLRFIPGYSLSYGFEDVSPDDWYYDAVIYVSQRSLLTGVTETDYGPAEAMNRAMFVTVIGRLSEAEVDQTQSTGFADVVSDGWSTGYINWAVENGIVNGYDDGTFGQYKQVTREQIAVMLYRYAQFEGLETGLAGQDLSTYPDWASVSDYAKTGISWAVENGIITGSDGKLDPGGVATRAQAAVMLERFLTAYIDK